MQGCSRWLAGIALLTLATLCPAAQDIPLYTYYVDPPFVSNDDDSLTDKLAAWLTARAAGQYRFNVVRLPRRRLDAIVRQPHWSGVVAWANPQWFGEEKNPRQLWSQTYMLDANLIVSPRSHPIDYRGDRSLIGLRLGSVLGFSYPDLNHLIQSGKIVRDDANGEFQNLLKLKAGRVQVAFLQASSLPYFRKQFPDFEQWAYVADQPRTVFTRSLFTSRDRPELMAFLNAQLEALVADPSWQALMGTCAILAPRLPAKMAMRRALCRQER